MTKQQLIEIKKRSDAATPIENWKDESDWYHDCRVGVYLSGNGDNDEADADFIAHAREDVLALIAEVERLNERNQKVVERLKEALENEYEFLFPENLNLADTDMRTYVAQELAKLGTNSNSKLGG